MDLLETLTGRSGLEETYSDEYPRLNSGRHDVRSMIAHVVFMTCGYVCKAVKM